MSMDRPLKIAYIIDSIETDTAGTEKQLLQLLKGLNRSRVKPYLICFYQSEWMKKQVFDFPVADLRISRLLSFQPFRAYRIFKKIHQQENFDIVQTFFKDGNLFGTIAAHFAGCKVIISSRRNTGYWLNGFHTATLRFLRRWTTAYLGNSKAAAEQTRQIEKVPAEKTAVIYNALDLDKFKAINPEMRREQREKWQVKDDEILIGMVGNLRPVKNVDGLIDAAWKLTETEKKLRFVVLGEGSERERLENKIREYGLGNKFMLPGKAENVVPCLAGFDIAVLCSSGESFSNSLIEYMAAGLPVAVSEVGGNNEAITHNETGLLYAFDDANGLIGALVKLIKNREFAEKLGKSAQKEAFARFQKEIIIEKHEQYYHQLLKDVSDEKNN